MYTKACLRYQSLHVKAPATDRLIKPIIDAHADPHRRQLTEKITNRSALIDIAFPTDNSCFQA